MIDEVKPIEEVVQVARRWYGEWWLWLFSFVLLASSVRIAAAPRRVPVHRLKNGLPGIATNLLADRLRELESSALSGGRAPPLFATTLSAWPAGLELDPVLRAIGLWGVRF